MSKHINVNPGQYKVAGREKMGKPISQTKQPHGQTLASRKQNGTKRARKRDQG